MMNRILSNVGVILVTAILFLGVLAPDQQCHAQNKLGLNEPQTVVHVNGMRFQGRVGSLPKMGATLSELNSDPGKSSVILVDDEVREVFMSRFNVANMSPYDVKEEEFEIPQKVHKGATMTEIGSFLYIGNFDEYGRRIIRVETAKKPETVFQGITLINPRYVRLEGVVNSLGDESPWDMRMALTAVPTPVLVKVLERQIKDADDSNERLRLFYFYLQAQKYRQAEEALRSIQRDFPGLKEDLKQPAESIRAQVNRQVLEEAEVRRQAGQPAMSAKFLSSFNSSIGIASTVAAEIGQARKRLKEEQAEIENTRKLTTEMLQRVLDSNETSGELKEVVTKFLEEVKSELGYNNAVRLSTFVRLADDPSQTDEQKLSIALSGWVMGAGSAIENIGESQSLLLTRQLVLEYLRSKRPERRSEILEQLATIESGAPQYLDKIVKQIRPPLAPSPAEIQSNEPIRFEIEIPRAAGQPPIKAHYLIQLPPEYDSHRRYPCVLTLGGNTADTTPKAQIDWWCGPLHERLKIRTGHAARRGYIVLAPEWMEPSQGVYKFSDREHAIVLKTLRHAIKRFSIDTDRVFLSGHYSGGNAAWDIAQAHPEHWAGVIPISARASKYINHYSDNGKFNMKWYFINGARDFPSRRANAKVWNDQMRSRDFDNIIVFYKGRGTEKFADDLPNMFQWMAPQSRTFDVREFECSTLRPWDNYFWWVEFNLRGNQKMRLPEEGWNKANLSDWIVRGEVPAQNVLRMRGIRDDATVWLLPELIDFSKDVTVDMANSKNDFKGGVQPSRKTLLEDVRTRGDRQHPYWAKVVRRNKRWQVEE